MIETTGVKIWDQLTIGYMAGLIDGEGCITFQKNGRKTPNARISLRMTDEESVRRIHIMSGIGHVGGPYQNNLKDEYKDYWVWQVYKAKDIARLLCAIAPLLSNRKQLKCLEAAESIQLRSQPKNCLQCNTLFQGRPNQKYCSKGCRIKFCNDSRYK